MNKCIWIRKLYTILQVGMSKKTRFTLTRLDDKYADFSSQQPFKIDGKLMKNEARAPDTTKTHFFHQFVLDKAFPALPRSVQRSLQTVPGLSGGSQKVLPNPPRPPKSSPTWQKGFHPGVPWTPPGCLGCSEAFLGSILDAPGISQGISLDRFLLRFSF